MVYSTVDLGIRISSSFCTEFPDCPTGLMFLVEKLYKSIRGISVSSLRVC